MSEVYQPTDAEKKLLARFVLDRSVHEWDLKDKIAFIALVNKKAKLPFGTIGLLRTEHKDRKTNTVTVTEIPYASRQTTVELAAMHGVSTQQMKESIDAEMAIYTYRAILGETGRFAEAVGACSLCKYDGQSLDPTSRANKIMHAETKAKRRATLEVCGLAYIDDTEATDIEGAKIVDLEAPAVSPDATTKEVVKPEAPKGNGKPAVVQPTPQAPPVTPAVSAPPVTTTTATATTETVEIAQAGATESVDPTPAPAVESPSNGTASPQASAASSTMLLPIPARYSDNALFAGDDDNVIVADKEHMGFIVAECTQKCGWDTTTMSKWLFDTFNVRNSNAKETLTLANFKRIAAGIDAALTSAGR